MKFIVAGYESNSTKAEGRVLYAGNSGELAKEAMDRPVPGIMRKALFRNPQPYKSKRCHGAEAPVISEGGAEAPVISDQLPVFSEEGGAEAPVKKKKG